MARTGGQALAADVNAFAVTHQGAPTHMTVVGHSYGSTTVSDAAAGFGMHADDVVLVGSPGTDLAHSAADFHLSPGGHLCVAKQRRAWRSSASDEGL
jgi:pimeloyl-ACP methyl ester carboxylesterase